MTTRVFRTTLIVTLFTLGAAARLSPPVLADEADSKASLRQALDAYFDGRWLPKEEADKATTDILQKLRDAGCTVEEVEQMVRAGRAAYGDAKLAGKPAKIQMKRGDKTVDLMSRFPGTLMTIPLECEHVDYKTTVFLYVPKSYDPAKPSALLLVGHGGNALTMTVQYATQAMLGGVMPWLPVVDKKNMLLAAPLSQRGWMTIGNSILLSAISRLQRQLNIDPDRIYVTGHSMGGHLSWRSGIYLGDRWGAVSPMSGGYDYVADKQIFPLVNVPGYATFGTNDVYHINDFDRKMGGWMTEHDFDWKVVEKPGGHEIFNDEIPKAADFLLAHPRNVYRSRVYGVGGKTVVYDDPEKKKQWGHEHTWNPERPIQRSTFHWIRMYPLPQDTPADKSTERVWAENLGNNHIKITSQFARRLRIYLHPKMVDFSKQVEVTANGRTVFNERVAPKVKTMLELVREYDDRGRIFHAAIDIDIPTDAAEMPEPRGDADKSAGK
jgi:hypothetical protein